MRALITGGTGFLGSNLAAALVNRGWTVRILRRQNSSLRALEGIPVEEAIGDILDPPSLCSAMQNCQTVFHAAGLAQYWRVPRETVYQVNVDGTRNVLQAAQSVGVERVVHTSSIAAFGIPETALVNETHGFPATSEGWAYGHSKYLAEQEVAIAVAQGLSAVIVNPAIIMGPRDINFVGGELVRASLKGQLRIVPPGGSSTIHVNDVVYGHIAAAEKGRNGERYILGAQNLTHWEMADTLAQVTGGAKPIAVLPKATLPMLGWAVDTFNRLRGGTPLVSGEQIRLSAHLFFMDSTKAVTELGLPQTPFQKAAQDAWDWYKTHKLI